MMFCVSMSSAPTILHPSHSIFLLQWSINTMLITSGTHVSSWRTDLETRRKTYVRIFNYEWAMQSS
jgi:hypothetical protein